MIILILKNGAETSTLKFTRDIISLGRAKENNIILNDKKVSRMHAKIERIGATYQIRDLESGNGTWVNGRKVDFHALSLGDEIRLGDSHLVVQGFDDEEATSSGEPGNAPQKTPVSLPQKLQVKDKIAQIKNLQEKAPPAAPDPPAADAPGAT